MANVLITGGSGLVGWRAAEQLVEAGHKVLVYDLRPNEENLAGFRDRITVVSGDIMDMSGLLLASKRHDTTHILHLAAYIAHESANQPVASIKVNALGTANVFDVALALGVERVTWTSTTMTNEYNDDYDASPVDESYRVSPTTPYGVAKYACEIMSKQYRNDLGLDLIGIRPSLAFGVGRLTGGTGLFNEAIRRIALGLPATIHSSPGTLHQPIYNRDMAAFLVKSLFVARPEHCIYNTPVNANYTGSQVVEVIKRVVPDAEIAEANYPEYAVGPPVMDGSLARKEIGFEPDYTLESAIREMVSMFRSREAGTHGE